MQGKKNIITADLCIAVLIAAISVYMFCASMPLSTEAKLFPQVISAVTFLFTIYAIGRMVVKARTAPPEAQAGEGGSTVRRWNHLILIALAFLYLVLLKPVGFLICTAVLFVGIPVILGNRKFQVTIPVAIIATILFYVVFKKFFYVALPSGILTFI